MTAPMRPWARGSSAGTTPGLTSGYSPIDPSRLARHGVCMTREKNDEEKQIGIEPPHATKPFGIW